MALVLLLSEDGDGIPIALRLASEGHMVDIFIANKKTKYIGLDGYENPKQVLSPFVEDYELILSDMVGHGELCDTFIKKGKLVVGGGSFNDKIELDRLYGSKVIKKLTTTFEPSTTLIETTTQLISHIRSKVTPWVVKPLNNAATYLTLVSEDPDNKSLLSCVKKLGPAILPCIVQEKIDGLEISTEGWFNGFKFIKPYNHTFEKKRLMEGDKGPNTGCMGNVVFLSDGDPLTEKVLDPLIPLLQKVNYKGPIDVNCIISNGKVYFLEFTARFGYDALQAQAELLKMTLYDFFFHIATGGDDLVVRADYINDLAIAVRLSVSPYPSKKDLDKWKGIQVLKLDEGAKRHIWLADVMLQNGCETLAGIDGVIGCVTARGINVKEAQRRVYRTIKNVVINSDVQYRNDIGDNYYEVKEQFDRWCDANR